MFELTFFYRYLDVFDVDEFTKMKFNQIVM